MKRRLFTGLAAATALAASLLITSGAVASAQTAAPPAAGSTSSAGATTSPNPLDAVKVDETKFKIVVTLRGVGKQVYDCTNGTYAFREPMAGLFTSRGIPAGIHGATTGPTAPFWANFDGSRVVGNTTAGPTNPDFVAVNAPNPTRDVKWLRIPAASNAGAGGAFSNVKFIQRINTRGGAAPTSCGAQTISLDYTTDYVFWAPK